MRVVVLMQYLNSFGKSAYKIVRRIASKDIDAIPNECWKISAKIHCKKSVLKIQEYIHEGANLKFYIPEFFNFKLLIPEYSPIYRF
jgi:hypothetical protein